MAPYADEAAEQLDSDIRDALVELAESEPDKPWVLVGEVSSSENVDEEEVRSVLRSLTLRGTLTPTATGKIRSTTDPSEV